MNSRVVVVSHACVLGANQSVYAHLEQQFDVTLVVPRTWRDALRQKNYPSQRWPSFRGPITQVRTIGRGRPQRHVALVNATSLLRRSRADFVLIEEEPFSLSAMYWSRAARALRLPYAVQVAENLDRHLPYMLRRARMKVLGGASVVLARSPSALERAQQWGFHGEGVVLGHGIESTVSSSDVRPGSTVGFVGRLVEAKGVDDLIAALNAHPELRLRVAGDGALRDRFAQLADRVEMLGTLAPEALDDFYRSLDVVAVPSRTTPTWSEQFGRVLVEAQGCATAVVAYDSGEIPWVASLSSVVLVHEGDVETLGRVLSEIASDPQRARQLGESGRAQVEKHFTNAALAQQLAPLITAALRAK